MTRRQIEQFRARLIEQLTALYREVQGEIRESMLREVFDPDQPRDEVDASQRTQLHETGARLADTEALRAQEIQEALRRMQAGQFGECVDCGQAISLERLRLLPWTARCVDCQESVEAEARHRLPGP